MQEHITNQTIIIAMGSLWSFSMTAGWMLYRLISKKLDEICKAHHNCREELPKEYLLRDEFKEWCRSRNELWHAINNHKHSESGEVIRSAK
jgi:hypothetical protein